MIRYNALLDYTADFSNYARICLDTLATMHSAQKQPSIVSKSLTRTGTPSRVRATRESQRWHSMKASGLSGSLGTGTGRSGGPIGSSAFRTGP